MPAHRRCCCGDSRCPVATQVPVPATPSPGWRPRWWRPPWWSDLALIWAELRVLRDHVDRDEGRHG